MSKNSIIDTIDSDTTMPSTPDIKITEADKDSVSNNHNPFNINNSNTLNVPESNVSGEAGATGVEG